MMVTVGLLGFIVLGLVSMFVHTQRAFQAGMAQTDVLENGRAVTELIARELEETTPSQLPNVVNFYSWYEANTFNTLPGSTTFRTNLLSYFFALVEKNRKWTGVGYVVASPPTNAIMNKGVGTLYRFEYPPDGNGTNDPSLIPWYFADAVRYATNSFKVPGSQSNVTNALVRVADGIMHLKVLAYDTNGVLLTSASQVKNTTITTNLLPYVPGATYYTFTSNAVPAYLDLELGVLESQSWERYRAIPVAAAAQSYLQRQANAIHVFRRRIAIHNFDPEAYQ
jgi:hypothetical protein